MNKPATLADLQHAAKQARIPGADDALRRFATDKALTVAWEHVLASEFAMWANHELHQFREAMARGRGRRQRRGPKEYINALDAMRRLVVAEDS